MAFPIGIVYLESFQAGKCLVNKWKATLNELDRAEVSAKQPLAITISTIWALAGRVTRSIEFRKSRIIQPYRWTHGA
jgi:hypothetical protein